MSLDSLILMGSILSGIAYGVVLAICIFVLCMSFSRGSVPRLFWRPLMTCWLLSLATVCTALQIKWTLLAFVTQRQDVSPSVFIEKNNNNRIYVMLYVLYVIINWSADGLMVFRVFCIFERAPEWCILPAVLFLSSLVTGSLALRELASPGTTQDSNKLTNWLIIYRTVSLSLCIILTSLIAGRLITFYLRSPKSRHSTSPYKDAASMLVKSAMLETVSILVYVISVALRSPLQNVFLPILGQVQVIAPMLIICRVVYRGRDGMTGLPRHYDMTKPKLVLQIDTATPFSSMGYEFPASPTMSIRGFDSPFHTFLPPYTADPFKDLDFPIGIVPQIPSANPVHISWVQKLGIKRTVWQ
ncbi:hypothetical protein BJV77DRAFT_1006734 [Russula vinacea]|nr:hypothetical protein BJV77DRAFT_1006734 [Russula vinacea]